MTTEASGADHVLKLITTLLAETEHAIRQAKVLWQDSFSGQQDSYSGQERAYCDGRLDELNLCMLSLQFILKEGGK